MGEKERESRERCNVFYSNSAALIEYRGNEEKALGKRSLHTVKSARAMKTLSSNVGLVPEENLIC